MSEACPIVVLEAMASNVPVVSTNVGGVEEILLSNTDEPAGIVVESKNYVQIANAVNEIINNNHTRNKLIKNAEKNINSRFALKKCCESHLDIYMKYNVEHS